MFNTRRKLKQVCALVLQQNILAVNERKFHACFSINSGICIMCSDFSTDAIDVQSAVEFLMITRTRL